MPDVLDRGRYIAVPHKHDLDLGKSLIFAFVVEHIPHRLDDVRDIFRRRGASDKYKRLLEYAGLLDTWYQLE